jgi:uncharacterized damage-inducible protein DinB
MTQGEALADALKGLFSNPKAGWFTPISIAIQDLSAEQARQVPAERFNSVWGVVNHVRFWQDFKLKRLQGFSIRQEVLDSHHGWPPIPEKPDQADWEASQAQMLKANQDLAVYIKSLSDDALHRPVSEGQPTPYQVIQGIIAHNSYHACEVISIRHMLGLWLEKT